jgi:hypothetical protein
MYNKNLSARTIASIFVKKLYIFVRLYILGIIALASYFILMNSYSVGYIDWDLTTCHMFFCDYTYVGFSFFLKPVFVLSNPTGAALGLIFWIVAAIQTSLVLVSTGDLVKSYIHYINSTHNIIYLEIKDIFNVTAPKINFESIDFFFEGVLEGPWLVKFGFLFLTTTLVSLFSLSYLGMYGVFFLNVISLFTF